MFARSPAPAYAALFTDVAKSVFVGGDSLRLRITNTNLLFFGGDTASLTFELIMPQ